MEYRDKNKLLLSNSMGLIIFYFENSYITWYAIKFIR